MKQQVKTIDSYQQQLIGYVTFENSILYITQNFITLISQSQIKETAPLNGLNVINFVVGQHRQIALLYRKKYIQIRRIDRLRDVIHRIEGVTLSPKQDYPILKLIYDDLYLVNPSSIELISLKAGTRNKYSQLVREPEFNKIIDLLLLNLVDSLRICVLHLRNKLIFSIIPCPITQLHVQDINQVMLLCSPKGEMHSKRSYLVLLAQHNHLKILNLISLKQICEVYLQDAGEAVVELECDLQCECLMVRYVSRQTGEIIRNVVYKVNSQAYYGQQKGYFDESEPFILYHFEVLNRQCVSVLKVSDERNVHCYKFYYFSNGELNLFVKQMSINYRQSSLSLNCVTDEQFWKQNLQWKQIISTYLQIEDQNLTKNQKKLNYCNQDRQLQQYYQLTKDFDSIITRFSDILTYKSQYCTLNQQQIQQEWQEYLEQIAINKNLLKETMNLFKLDYQIVKEPNQESSYIGIQLQNCMKDIEGREGRIDSRIKQKKKQLEQESKKQQQNQILFPFQRPKLSEAQVLKQQQQYKKFVAEYMGQIQRKRAAEAIADRAKKQKSKLNQQQIYQPRIKLQLPKLNQQQRRLIASSSFDTFPFSPSALSSHNQSGHLNNAQEQFELILNQIKLQISPLEQGLQSLIDKVDQIEVASLHNIKQNEDRLQKQMEINLENVVKQSCRGMLNKLSEQIKQQLAESMQKLCQSEKRSVRYYEDSIQKFKEYARAQMRYRVEMFHVSRKRLETRAQQMVVREKSGQNIVQQ